MSNVMPDLIRHPGKLWVPTFAGMTVLIYVIAGVIKQMMGEDMKAAISRKRDGTDFLVCVCLCNLLMFEEKVYEASF